MGQNSKGKKRKSDDPKEDIWIQFQTIERGFVVGGVRPSPQIEVWRCRYAPLASDKGVGAFAASAGVRTELRSWKSLSGAS
jgi:hypothetical protein